MSSYILGNISIDKYDISNEMVFINEIPRVIEEYDAFFQVFWKNVSLMNKSGDKDDSQYSDSDLGLKTFYGEKTPKLFKLIEENFTTEKLRMVRARNLIDGMVIPHSDFVELDYKSKKHFRVFLPLEENHDSFHSDINRVFQMKLGEIWFLDAFIPNAAINFSNRCRLFLCLDFVFSEDFLPSEIFKDKTLYNPNNNPIKVQRKLVSKYDLEEIEDSISKILNDKNYRDILFAVSKLHFNYEFEVDKVYNFLINAAIKSSHKNLIPKLYDLKKYLIEDTKFGERFSLLVS